MTSPATPTNDQPSSQKQQQILNNSKIKSLIAQGLQTGMNVDKLKEQIVMMAQANYSLDKILTFTAYEINTSKKQLENLKSQAKTMPGSPSSGPQGQGQQQQQEQTPYFSVRPPIPTYAINEMNLVILLRLYEEATAPQQPKEKENREFFYSSKPLHEFVDQTSEYLFFSNPNSDDKTEMDIVKTRMEFLKELSKAGKKEKEEGGKEEKKMTLERLKELQADKTWITKLSEDQKKAYEDTLSRIKKAVRAAIRDLNWFGYVHTDVFSAHDHVDGEGDPSKDRIILQRKGWAYLHLYLHVWTQADQKNAFYFFVNMGLDRNFNW